MIKGLGGVVLGLYAVMHPLDLRAQQAPQASTKGCAYTRESLSIPPVSAENMVAESKLEGSDISLRIYNTQSRPKEKLAISTEDELYKFLQAKKFNFIEYYESNSLKQFNNNPSAIIHLAGGFAKIALDLEGKNGFGDGCFEYTVGEIWDLGLIDYVTALIFSKRVGQ